MRLIDAEGIRVKPEFMHNVCGMAMIRVEDIVRILNEQPTIEPEPYWIPCSERLPEENDYKSCIECLDGAVWYFTKNGTMGLGYYYESTKQWSTTDDLKTDGTVIAWMPLPERYQGKRKGADNG